MTAIIPLGLPWNAPLLGERNRSIFAPPRYRLQRNPPRPVQPPPDETATAPADAPLTLDEVVLHLRLDPDAASGPEAPLIEGMIAAAARHLENFAGVTLLPTEWRMTIRHFPPVWNDPLDLPMPPFDELLAVVMAGKDIGRDQFAVEIDEMLPARLYPKSGYWPRAWSPTPAMIAIDWRAGYATPAEVPSPLKLAMKMAIAHWYENRESSQQWQLYPVIELGWNALLDHYRTPGFA